MKISLVTELPEEVQAVIDQLNRDASQTSQNDSQTINEVKPDEVHIDTNPIQ